MSFTLVQVIVGGLLLGAVYALFSSGLTLIWGMMNVINFAHGDFVMLGMYVAFVVWSVLGVGPAAAVPAAAHAARDAGRRELLPASSGTSCAGRCWRRSSAPSAWRCCCAMRRSGTSAPISTPCRTISSAAPSNSADPLRGVAAARGRRRAPRHRWAASHPHAHRARQPHARGRGGRDRPRELMGIRPQRMQATRLGARRARRPASPAR